MTRINEDEDRKGFCLGGPLALAVVALLLVIAGRGRERT